MDQLAKDMIQCKADGYGCHYGAWHAAVIEPQMEAPVERYPKKKPVEKSGRPRCIVCGAEIPAGSKRTTTCGPSCADIRRRQQVQEHNERRRQEKLQAEK